MPDPANNKITIALPCYGIIGRRGIVFWHKVGSNAGIARATAARILASVGADIDQMEQSLLEKRRNEHETHSHDQ